MIFEVKGGSYSYDGKNDVFNNISFSVSEPEILSILGANGAGKTTLMKCMIGLLRWAGGSSLIDGCDIRNMAAKAFWKRVGYVPQAKQTSFVYTVGELALLGRNPHLGEFAMPREKDFKIVDEALDILGILHLKDKLCSRISGGEYQLAVIARAVAAKPSLLVLDEPESNLDFKNQMLVLRSISMLCKERDMSAVINTHYPEHALDISQKALLLMPDKKVIFGESAEVLHEKNLQSAFDVPVHIHRFRLGKKEYACILPMEEETCELTERVVQMETRIAQIGIIVEDPDAVEKINTLLHEYSKYIVGRMGLPYKERNISIISVILDAPNDVISAVSGKLGMYPGVSAKTVYSKI